MRQTEGALHKRGKVWVATWTHDGKLYRVSTRTGDRREAETVLQKLVLPFRAKEKIDVLANLQARVDVERTEAAKLSEEMNPAPPLGGLWKTFLNAPSRPDSGPATLNSYEFQVGRFVQWVATAHPSVKTIRDVSPRVAEEFMVFLGKEGLSPNRHNKYLTLFRMIWRVLKDSARLTVDPWEKIARRRLKTVSRRELTVEELRNVCGNATGELRTMFALGLFTGLRFGDVASLRWSEVDLVRGILTRVPNKTGRFSQRPVIVPLVPELKALLLEVRKDTKGPYVCPDAAALYKRDSSALSKQVRKHFIKCGIDPYAPGTGPSREDADGETEKGRGGKAKKGVKAVVEVGFHSLRHSFVSLSRLAGVPLAVVESVVGHSNPAMTKHYTHVGIEASTQAVAALPHILTPGAKTLKAAANEPVPKWVKATLESMTDKNWKRIRMELVR